MSSFHEGFFAESAHSCAAQTSSTHPAPGTLYGIGVGPGSPDLLTLRAVNILQSVDIILAAASPKNDHSNALAIAQPHLPAHAEILRLDFPMTRDTAVLQKAWGDNAQKVAAVLRSGKSAAFLTLGDPLIYSTFGYLMQTLEKLDPTLPIRVVPGITSYQEAAAKTRTILCEGTENLLLIAGINDAQTLDAALASADSAIILKTYRNSSTIFTALKKAERHDTAVFASRLGMEGEITVRGMQNAPEKPHYLSLVLAPPKR